VALASIGKLKGRPILVVGVALLLVLDVGDDIGAGAFPEGDEAVLCLPGERNTVFFVSSVVDQMAGRSLQQTDETGDRDSRRYRYGKVHVIGHDPDCMHNRALLTARCPEGSLEDGRPRPVDR